MRRLAAAALAAAALSIAVVLISRARGPEPVVPVAPPASEPRGNLASGRVLGAADAPVALDIWADFQCPMCRTFSERIKPRLTAEYFDTGKARLTFHDMAFIGDESGLAATAARCAGQHGKFWPYHDLLFANQGPANTGVLTPAKTEDLAATLGLDRAAFSACLTDQDVQNGVAAETAEAYARGIKETPTLLVNGREVKPVTNWVNVSSAIDAALESR